jgi:hypothetical protein
MNSCIHVCMKTKIVMIYIFYGEDGFVIVAHAIIDISKHEFLFDLFNSRFWRLSNHI